ncbi:MAG: phospholipase D-like domain-containing protein [Promethearchaeota archaeon]
MTPLKYLNTIKGNIIKAISVDEKYEWSAIRDHLGVTDEQLRPYIKELKTEEILEERSSQFRVEYNLWLSYKAHFGDEWAKKKLKELEEGTEWRQVILRKIAQEKAEESNLKTRIRDWIKFKKIPLPENSSHLFLKWNQIDSLLQDLIPLTKKEIIVVNPYVEKSGLCDLLRLGVNRGVNVELVTRSPIKDYNGSRKTNKILYHKNILESGIQLFYNEEVHAKLFILDKQVLIASSMNLYSESIAGKLWEAGIASIDDSNVKLALNTYEQLLSDPYTKKQT